VLRLRRNRRPPERSELALDFGDGKTPERRRADARRAHYEHQTRLLEVKALEQQMSSLRPGGLNDSPS
jgi:hypothetical protein